MRLPRVINRLLGPKKHVLPAPRSIGQDASTWRTGPIPRANFILPTPYVLTLRTFGLDGAVRVGNPREGEGFEKVTLESIIVDALRDTDLHLVALHDEGASQVPYGVKYLSTANEHWEQFFWTYVARAEAIIAVTTGRKAVGDSFRRELQYLRESGTDKVVLVAHPELTASDHQSKTDAFEQLGWPVPKSMPLVAWPHADGRIAVFPSLGRDDDSLKRRYYRGMSSAIASVTGRQGRT